MATEALGVEILEPNSCWELLRANDVGRLAVTITDHPFEIDGYDRDSGEAWSVVIKGAATEIERMQDVFEPHDISGRRFRVLEASDDARRAVPRAREE